ncbi:hypothetical protein [Echinimonas agarilytica]|uniref:Uncharacterized protein n=1 Tax=Echinimonas agarilytica TaxID=1215918 RepID=A0AA41W3M1_9GAMM|nr:hypothetical protein [Echinimonas agarilytica]MCM2678227.1 hypothetical protein [Echinimonas agarilytica]
MKAKSFVRYVEQFGFSCIEKQHVKGLKIFITLWGTVFAVLFSITAYNWSAGYVSWTWITLDMLVVVAFSGCAWQRYQLKRYIDSYRQKHPEVTIAG